MFDAKVSPYRDLTVDDLPWCLSLGHRRYPATYDPGGALSFLAIVIRNPSALTIRSADAFMVAHYVHGPAWRPNEPECHVMLLCADMGAHWQAAKLLRRSVELAKQRGCVRWRFHSETEANIDGLARWVGARQDSPRWVID